MKVVLRLIVLMLTSLVLSSGAVFAATWKWVNSDSLTGWFYDSSSMSYGLKTNIWGQITGLDTTKIVCWEKTVFTPEGAAFAAKEYGDSRLCALDHTISLVTFSLPDKMYTSYMRTFYATNGTVITSSDYTYTEKILPDSWGDIVFRDIVVYASENREALARRALGL